LPIITTTKTNRKGIKSESFGVPTSYEAFLEQMLADRWNQPNLVVQTSTLNPDSVSWVEARRIQETKLFQVLLQINNRLKKGQPIVPLHGPITPGTEYTGPASMEAMVQKLYGTIEEKLPYLKTPSDSNEESKVQHQHSDNKYYLGAPVHPLPIAKLAGENGANEVQNLHVTVQPPTSEYQKFALIVKFDAIIILFILRFEEQIN
jgi:hypothetical protein